MRNVPYANGIHPAPLGGWGEIWHRLVFYPILITQGLWVKWTTIRLQEPKGPREGVIGEGADFRLLILGDSSAAGVGVKTQNLALSGRLVDALSTSARVDWQLIARCGDTTPMALRRLNAAHPRRADVAVTGLGVNDIIRGTRLHVWLAQQQALLDSLIGPHGVKHVYVTGIPQVSAFPRLPNPLRWALGHQAARFDRALWAMLADHPNATFVAADMDLNANVMAQDGFHPGAAVYQRWADILAARIRTDQEI